ncbi:MULTISPECIES: Bug family tripartite tricarboxylate transporter substrate binding protein [Ramlibacter]|uniref:Tripartite tricarboxylate transporter substrate binding protein n=1 Tax=Ramlibacter pinisoli TaxID=2682844 RepID=A0A6N8ITD9_9BURK|nr:MULTISPECIES: tripartite tricarboxylate transporter substrate binding protein [Ramlibacter]MBA2965017.1 tripartite tricarboxylate transporter substrate binding protein [Ramlibacter sp. CGMCC 1.13660]MVQ29982.1 tripartite tricarboxylate transporter substrate binding protein [Ramlibacter pinisoli]
MPLLASAQVFPDRPITFVVPFAAGAATDQVARAVAGAVATATRQSVVVENKPGANGFIGVQFVAKATADGHTVLVTTNSTQVVNLHLFRKLPYDPVADFAPVTALGRGGQFMVVKPSFPAKTVAELVALAKKDPGTYSFGAGSSQSRVGVELLQQMAGIRLLHVPYKANAQALSDLMGGQTDMMMADATLALPQIKAGTLRALGYSGDKRSALAPDVPTVAEAGVPGYDMGYWFAAYVPAKTPPAVVRRLNELLVAAAHSEAARTAFYGQTGTEILTTTPEGLAQFQADESRKWAGIVKSAGIEPE